jgi:hypothetical protein
MAKKEIDLNYDFDFKAPKKPMGNGSFANMPDKPIMKPFDAGASYRMGLMNNPATGIDYDSGVDENGCR